jgi:hypothetical protein
MLPKKFKPNHQYDLLRLGKDNDGGYLVERKSIKDSKALVSFGLSVDWSFEKDFMKKHSNKNIHCYDHTVNNFFFKKLIVKKFLKIPFKGLKEFIKTISLYFDYISFFKKNKKHFIEKIGNEKNSTGLLQTIKRIKDYPIFLKIDIEGSEYRILDDLIINSELISGLAIEFHDIDLHEERISNFIDKFPLTLVHTHGNNFSPLDSKGNPLSIEMSFSKNPMKIGKNCIIPNELDQKNNPKNPEAKLIFEE